MRSNIFLFAVLVSTHPVLFADLFVLRSGAKIEGEWLNKEQSPRKDYSMRLASGGRVLFDKAQVEEVVEKTDAEKWYDKYLPIMPDTAAAHLIMARECEERKLHDQREFHLQEVLRFEPDHVEARKQLGYTKIKEKWVRPEDLMTKRGYVRYESRWRLPQELEIELREEERDDYQANYRKLIKRWRGWIVKNGEKALEGERSIRELRDPAAALPLAELLDDDKEFPLLKLLYIDTLASLPGGAGVSAILKRALQDRDYKVRERALDAIELLGPKDLVGFVAKGLKSENNAIVHRSAQVLARLKSPDATLPLIEALFTKHKQQIAPINPGQTTTSFDKNSGAGGMSFGGERAKIIEIEVRNDPVLTALTSIHTGINHGFNKEAWRRWYALERSSKEVSLRRTE